jgi:cbb3-type cytochrome oxidase subunit 3
MAGYYIIGLIGLVCLILSFFAGVGDDTSRIFLIVFGILFLGYSGYIFLYKNAPRKARRTVTQSEQIMADIDDMVGRD